MRFASLFLCGLFIATQMCRADQEYRFIGEIEEWASLFSPQPPGTTNEPLAYAASLIIPESPADWTFTWVTEGDGFETTGGNRPQIGANINHNWVDLEGSAVEILSLEQTRSNDISSVIERYTLFVDPEAGVGDWAWSRQIFCPDCTAGAPGFANATITAVRVLSSESPGDFNGDGRVDAADYTIWADGREGLYDEADYTAWRDNYGAVYAAATGTTIPEPASTLLLLAFGALSLQRRVR